MGLKRTTDPTTPLLTTAQAKLHLRVDHSDEDTPIDSLVKAATYKAEDYCRRAFVTQSWTYTLDRFPLWELKIPRPPLISLTSLTYIDTDGNTQTLSSSAYRLATNGTPARLTPAYNTVWPVVRPQTIDSVTLVYSAGYGSASSNVPEPIVSAVKLILGHLYNVRDENAEIPKQALWLLDGYRVKDWSYGDQ